MKRVSRQPQLERHAARGELGATKAENEILYEVGDRYRALYEAAIESTPTAKWDMRVSGGAPDCTVLHSAKQKLRRIEGQLGRIQVRGLRKVCIEGRSAEEWAISEGETRTGVGLAMLRVALRELHRILAA